MTKENFIIEHERLEKEYEEGLRIAIEKLKFEYLKTNAKFKIGDFIYNVTGIIKVDKIACEIFMGGPRIKYIGERYWKKDMELIKTKTTLKGSLIQEFGIKQIIL